MDLKRTMAVWPFFNRVSLVIRGDDGRDVLTQD
jgi:hypothetical protein